ncbi:hypothetical protein ANN_17296 [Periplaneta americana]|uniref:Uncharacterized protein n=1 Tax=Periplaneta americana TaxID=6978 RepID=A0ABQ8STU3_PERAM|nr:hypothetical protein ANN_17296 [Periplaneta americana]
MEYTTSTHKQEVGRPTAYLVWTCYTDGGAPETTPNLGGYAAGEATYSQTKDHMGVGDEAGRGKSGENVSAQQPSQR